MKKLMMIAALMLMCVGASAQEKGLKCLGAGLAYGIDKDYKAFSLNAKAQYNVTKYFRGEVDLKFYPKQDDAWRVLNVNLNLQYLFPTGDSEKFFIYPTAGVGLFSAHESGIDTENAICFQGGAGAEYHFNDKLKFFAEAVFQHAEKDVLKINWPVLGIGAAYYF